MSDAPLPDRRTPAQGVHVSLHGSNWVFLTVCTKNRDRWLAQPAIQRALHGIWLQTTTTGLVSDYLLMPDHLHLFCAPHDLSFTIEHWITYWKNCLAKTCADAGRFQRNGFHHRLRNGESYSQKWQYVRENPVRAGLANAPGDRPYQGQVHPICWSGS